MKKFIITTLVICISEILNANTNILIPLQNIRGQVVDASTGYPLIGANVLLLSSEPAVGTVSDQNGRYELLNVPIGRVSLEFSYIGYESRTFNNVILSSGKELILDVELQEKVIESEEVVIKAHARKDQPLNDMAIVSARSFTVEETEKYAGSWGDPSRMATNFAGVMASSDQNNDIIIRGNSPQYMLWRMEGIDIPNPSHFGAQGQTGGPISMLNNNTLSNSDFFTGAFPSEYGNALSGVFDLQLRNGNIENREYLFQMGFNGFEAGAEGPFVKDKNATYIINYRYSVMGTLDLLGIDLGIGATPYYSDLSFKINVPETNAGSFSIFGLYGHNDIAFDDGHDTTGTKYISEWKSDVFVGGISHRYFFNENTRIETTLGASTKKDYGYYSFYEFDSEAPELFHQNPGNFLEQDYGDETQETKFTFKSDFKKKLNSKNDVLVGVTVDYFMTTYKDSITLPDTNIYYSSIDTEGEFVLYRGFAQWMHRFSNNITAVAGLQYQQSTLNSDISLEPRASLRYKINNKTSINLGYGLHSMLQPRIAYYTETLVDSTPGNLTYLNTNKALDFTKSHHTVLGIDYLIKRDVRLKAETYYQYLYNIPVKSHPDYFSMVNYGTSLYVGDLDSLVNEGTAYNYGVEITVEQFFNQQYYYLITASLFESKYEGSDGKIYNSLYNGNWVLNALGGYEFKVGREGKNVIALNAKIVWAGGLRKINIDEQASIAREETVFDFENAFSERNPDYYRVDFRCAYRINSQRFTTELAIDITNLTNHKNSFVRYYDPVTKELKDVEFGIVPMMTLRVTW